MKLTLTTFAASLAATTAMADLVIPDLSYRTGPYAANGIPFSDGYQDYFSLLNQRDGGIGGEPIRLIECETAYDTEKGVDATSRPSPRTRWSTSRSRPASPTS